MLLNGTFFDSTLVRAFYCSSMRYFLIATAVLFAFTFLGCKKEVVVIPKKVIDAKIDSILTIRYKETDINAQRDLDHRITIEVRVKADSIFRAQLQKAQTVTVQPQQSKPNK